VAASCRLEEEEGVRHPLAPGPHREDRPALEAVVSGVLLLEVEVDLHQPVEGRAGWGVFPGQHQPVQEAYRP
jgi:hypothetical protein